MDSLAGRCRVHGRRAVLFADSRFSSARVPLGREERQVRVRHSAVLVATSAVVHIPPAQPVRDSLRVQEWAVPLDCLLRECRPNQPDVQAHLRAGQDSAISTGPKRAR